MADGDVVLESKATPEQQAEAVKIGWAPPDQFKGDKTKWVDADVYLERGQQILPILRENNRRLSGELAARDQQIAKLTSLVDASQDSIKALQDFHAEDTKTKVEQARKDLIKGIVEARKADDVEGEVTLSAELTRLEAAQSAAAARPAGGDDGAGGNDAGNKGGPDPAADPAFLQWKAETPWFGTDRRKTAVAMAIAHEMRLDPQYGGLRGRQFLDAVTAEVEKTVKGPARPANDKVEGSRGGGGGSSGNGKSYTDLPVEAKQTCERQASRMVGEGRAFKDMKAWQTYYADRFFERP